MSREAHVRFCESRGVRFPPATHLVVLVHGTQADVETLREQIADVLAPLGLRLSSAKTRIVHMSDGFGFLGFRVQWKRKRGTQQWHVYTFIADRPIRSLKAKIRALTRRTSQQDLGYVLARLNMVMHGWARFFRHAVAKDTFSTVDNFAWWRVIRMLMERHHWRWKDVRRRLTTPEGHWLPITSGQTELQRIAAIPVTRYRYRGGKIPSPWPRPEHA
jgi:RNA-directed DNA polymerase